MSWFLLKPCKGSDKSSAGLFSCRDPSISIQCTQNSDQTNPLGVFTCQLAADAKYHQHKPWVQHAGMWLLCLNQPTFGRNDGARLLIRISSTEPEELQRQEQHSCLQISAESHGDGEKVGDATEFLEFNTHLPACSLSEYKLCNCPTQPVKRKTRTFAVDTHSQEQILVYFSRYGIVHIYL